MILLKIYIIGCVLAFCGTYAEQEYILGRADEKGITTVASKHFILAVMATIAGIFSWFSVLVLIIKPESK